MELRQLESFVGVADELHFGRAAERLYLAQSALSQHVRRLEQELDVTLFDRGKRRIRLTPAGTAFCAEARRILDRAERARNVAQVAAAGRTGVVDLAFLSSTPPAVLSRLLGALSRESDLFDVRLRELAAARIEGDLDDDLLDIAVIDGQLGHRGLEHVVLDDEPFVAVLPGSTRVEAGEPIALHELRDEVFVLPRAAWAPRLALAIVAACHEAGFHPGVVAEADSPSGWMLYVAAGQAVTLAPVSIASQFERNTIVAPLRERAPRSVTTLVWRTNASPHIHAMAERARRGSRHARPAPPELVPSVMRDARTAA
jgi:DNA-binding transcriptional LysR family regulator